MAVAGVSGFAYADADAAGQAERSPGLLSGNLVQLPVHTPLNVCGNTVSVVGVLNPAAGNRCANGTPGGTGHPEPRPAHPSAHSAGGSKQGGGNGGGATADGQAQGSPGLLSGNGLQLPVDLPVNLSGNAVSIVGVGNSATGNSSVNGEAPTGGKPVQPPVRPAGRPPVAEQPTATPPAPPRHTNGAALAHTGADAVGLLLPGGGALLLGGVLLYRRFRLN
ncbi:chaplin [Streptomyces sp. CB00455]|uniref:chaplin n=1 Tax=Streptomyces sp. CB00455 TaxID=1703927 RepID=UPI00237800C0|nr:chaplin [Streptomyces sp. CB00455]